MDGTCSVFVNRKKYIQGAKNIPPPIPSIPERNPIPPPNKIFIRHFAFGLMFESCLSSFIGRMSPIDAIKRAVPKRVKSVSFCMDNVPPKKEAGIELTI